MAKDRKPEEERRPDPQSWEPRSARKADGNDHREESLEPEQEHTTQDEDPTDSEKES